MSDGSRDVTKVTRDVTKVTQGKQEREVKRIQKEQEKASRQAAAAAAKGMKRENWMSYMDILIDQQLAQDKGGTEMMTTLQLEGLTCTAVTQPQPNSITFARTLLVAENDTVLSDKVHEDVVVIVEQAATISTQILAGTLLSYAARCHAVLSQPTHCNPGNTHCNPGNTPRNITFFIMGFDKLKSKKNSKMDRVKWEEGLLGLQMELSITTYLLDNIAELTEHIRMFCKAVGERPHKLQQNKDLFIGAHKHPLSVDKDGRGLLEVWIAQLQEIRSVNEAVARAVAHLYPAPRLLHNYLHSVHTDTALSTLADIQVRRGVGSLVSVRRVGAEAAKRIVLYYTSSSPQLGIS